MGLGVGGRSRAWGCESLLTGATGSVIPHSSRTSRSCAKRTKTASWRLAGATVCAGRVSRTRGTGGAPLALVLVLAFAFALAGEGRPWVHVTAIQGGRGRLLCVSG